MDNQRLVSRRNEKGFTLVELAIVMIIIGLLITGILKGQEMIANAQVTSTISQIKAIEAATSTFLDMYDAMPGDIVLPGTRLPNCTGTCATPATGGVLGNGAVDSPTLGGSILSTSEARLFFTHLAAADLLTSVSTNPDTATINFGDELPTVEMGSGGFLVGFTGNGGATSLIGGNMRSGHYLAISPLVTGVPATSGGGSITPGQAARVDRKIDDGMPLTGTTRAAGLAGAAGCATTTAGDPYQEANNQNHCSLYVRIR